MNHDATVSELPLVAQAQARLTAARAAENAARQTWAADPGNEVVRRAYAAAQREHRQAQGWYDQVTRSVAALPTALAEADQAVPREESAYASLLEAHRRAEAQQARQVQQARAQRDTLKADRRMLLGEAEACTRSIFSH